MFNKLFIVTNAMSIEEKAKYIDMILGFYFEELFLKGIEQFPSPEGEVESWYKFALVLEAVTKVASIPEEHLEILQLFIEDAITEYESWVLLGEQPDTEQELGVGYDGYEIPLGFATKYQGVIWREVLNVYRS